MKKITITFTDDQLTTLLNAVDAGIKNQGLPNGIQSAVILVETLSKIDRAIQANTGSNETERPPGSNEKVLIAENTTE